MTKRDTAKIMAILKVAYPAYYKELVDVETAVNLWTSMLADYNYNTVEAAVKVVIATSRYPPTIAEVISKINLATQPRIMNEAEAWSYVRKAISNSAYNSEVEFKKLPAECKSIVCSPEQLKTWALTDEDEVNTVVASNFQRAYRARAKQQAEYASLPASVRAMIGGVAQKMMEAQNE